MSKFKIYIRNPERFLQGDTYNGLDIVSADDPMVDWIERQPNTAFVQDVEIDDSLFDIADLTQKAVAEVDEKLKIVRTDRQQDINELEGRKANLLALPGVK